jgi:hypothetical protein
MVQSYRFVKTYADSLHVNMESLMPGRMGALTSGGEGTFALEIAAFHDSEESSTSNAAFGGFGGVSPPMPFPPVGGEVRRGG